MFFYFISSLQVLISLSLGLCMMQVIGGYKEIRRGNPEEKWIDVLQEACLENKISLSIGGYALLVRDSV